MFNDDTSVRDVLKISNYIDYRAELLKLERNGYNRRTPRGINESVEDLVNHGFQVTRVQCFDDNTLLPIQGRVDIYTRLLEK